MDGERSILDDPMVFAEVRKTLGEGRAPVVKIPIGAKVIRKKSGPPKRLPAGAKKHHFWKMQTPSGFAMRCRNPGCNVQLRRNDETITCSKRCATALLTYCKLVVDILEGRVPAQEFPPHYRTNRMPRRAARAA